MDDDRGVDSGVVDDDYLRHDGHVGVVGHDPKVDVLTWIHRISCSSAAQHSQDLSELLRIAYLQQV